MFATYCLRFESICFAALGAVCWWLTATSLHKFACSDMILWSWLAASVCHILFLNVSICPCHSGSRLLVLKSYQLTQNITFKYQFMLLAGCSCLSCIVFSMIHPVCATLAAVCWWLKATRLHRISFTRIIYEAGRLPLFTTHCFSVFQFGCAILGAVWWCVRATSLHNISFSNLILCGWLAVSVCHLLFSLRFNVYAPLWHMFDCA